MLCLGSGLVLGAGYLVGALRLLQSLLYYLYAFMHNPPLVECISFLFSTKKDAVE